MGRLGAAVRLLMLLACLVPFTSTRQAGIALAPLVPLLPLTPTSSAPAPVSEEDERETASGKERVASVHPLRRSPIREQVGSLPAAHTSHLNLTHLRASPPVSVDPFRNGLGSPYRC